ncbi:MAG: RhuM family protein [Bacteroidales bacterium]
MQTHEVNYYNLDVIISVGYRVKSYQGTQFRIWATQRLREYIVKGFTLNDERFTTGSSMNYFKELLDRIRQIRLSEKVFYRKEKKLYVKDIYILGIPNKLIYFTFIVPSVSLYHSPVDASL